MKLPRFGVLRDDLSHTSLLIIVGFLPTYASCLPESLCYLIRADQLSRVLNVRT